jgi:hypothetical protein
VKVRIYYHEGLIEHTSTCSIGVVQTPFVFSLTQNFTAAIGILVRPMTFALTAIFTAVVGLLASCRTWIDYGLTSSGAPVENSGWEVFTPNEDLTPLEWTAYGEDWLTGGTHYTCIDSDPATTVYDDVGPVYSPFIWSDQATGIQDKFGFSEPTAPTGAIYTSLTIRIVAGQGVITPPNIYGTIKFTAYAGGNTLGTATIYPLSGALGPGLWAASLPVLSVSKTDIATLQLLVEPYETIPGNEMYIYALDILGFWEVAPTGIEGNAIHSADDRSTTISSIDDRSISINSK